MGLQLDLDYRSIRDSLGVTLVSSHVESAVFGPGGEESQEGKDSTCVCGTSNNPSYCVSFRIILSVNNSIRYPAARKSNFGHFFSSICQIIERKNHSKLKVRSGGPIPGIVFLHAVGYTFEKSGRGYWKFLIYLKLGALPRGKGTKFAWHSK